MTKKKFYKLKKMSVLRPCYDKFKLTLDPKVKVIIGSPYSDQIQCETDDTIRRWRQWYEDANSNYGALLAERNKCAREGMDLAEKDVAYSLMINALETKLDDKSLTQEEIDRIKAEQTDLIKQADALRDELEQNLIKAKDYRCELEEMEYQISCYGQQIRNKEQSWIQAEIKNEAGQRRERQ